MVQYLITFNPLFLLKNTVSVTIANAKYFLQSRLDKELWDAQRTSCAQRMAYCTCDTLEGNLKGKKKECICCLSLGHKSQKGPLYTCV